MRDLTLAGLTSEERWVLVNALEDFRELLRDQADDYAAQGEQTDSAACLAQAETATGLLDCLMVDPFDEGGGQ